MPEGGILHDRILDAGNVGYGHIDKLLWILGAAGCQFGGPLSGAPQGLQELQGRQLTVAGGGVFPEDRVARLLTADGVAALQHLLQHMAVAYGGAYQLDPLLINPF